MKIQSVEIYQEMLFCYKKYDVYLEIFQSIKIYKKGKVILKTSLPQRSHMDWLPNNIIETFHIDPEVAMKLCKKLCRDMHNAIYEESQSGWYMRVEYADAESETSIFHHDHAAAELSDYIRKTLNRYDLCVPCTGRNYVENTKIRVNEKHTFPVKQIVNEAE